jgi:hypothetical protein
MSQAPCLRLPARGQKNEADGNHDYGGDMAAGAQAKPVRRPLVRVYLQDKADVPVFVKAQAQRHASHMFAEIGITLVWKEGNPSARDTGAIELGKNTPAALAPGALAFALPYEGRALPGTRTKAS